jgi:uncharacterized protein (TIGR03118 family)
MNSLRSMLAWLAAGAAAIALVSCGGGGSDAGMGLGTGTGTGMAYAATNLISSVATPNNPYGTTKVDAHLVNGWGIAFNPNAYVWVANNGSSTSTLYDGNGVAQSLVVSIPAGSAGDAAPTGIVFNDSTDFRITQGAASGASVFIFVGEAGTLAAWSPTVDQTHAVTVFDGATESRIYKGLAIAAQGSAHFLYAADFHNGVVDVFDSTFKPVGAGGAFTDPDLPTGYAPFGIQAIGDRIYVSYARQDAQAQDEVAGAGLGAVDVFDSSGALLKRLIPVGGKLNAPWGMALAPADFGPFSNDLLVANFGDGTINAFDPTTGDFVGTLSKADGSPIVIGGLWGIAFGNGLNAQPTNTLFYAAGPADETQGVYGRIDSR